jgi:hypothetical protein
MPAVGSQIGYAEDTVVASAIRTTSSDTGALPGYGGASVLRAQLQVTAASGTTPTLDVVIEDTLDAGATWNVVATFTQKTVAAREVINVLPQKTESATFQPVFADRIRVRWTLGGTTPSFTFSVVISSQSPMS